METKTVKARRARCHRSKTKPDRLLGFALAYQRLTVPAGKFFDAASRVDELLFTGKKRMTGGTNTNLDIAASRPSAIDRATCANNRGLCVVRMDVSLHVCQKRTKLSHSPGDASATATL